MPIQVYFKVRCETHSSQELRIVGDIPALGMWNPFNSLILHTNNEIYPFWVGQIYEDLEQNTLIQFKAVIIECDEIIWEQSENRAIQIRYQSQSVLFSFSGTFTQMVKIQSYYDQPSDSESESIDIKGARKIYLQTSLHPYDYEFMSSDSGKDLDYQSSKKSSLNSKSSSLEQLDNQETSQTKFVHISSFRF
ncbi:unnamed protein product [Paramecium pentaurelia]|uniref:CBM20 domain-containing protein n=1 Tax=Paramecium pentaurelia TaxID=43138 RepID=A0A8S1U8H7_9CILI|nr:unnamed protein product [Paramecium pentaurelia]